jgi:hypothetical protein
MLIGIGAGAATVGPINTVSHADAATRVVETWRLLRLALFTGLFGLLAYRACHDAGVSELAIAITFALAVFGIGYSAGTKGADQSLPQHLGSFPDAHWRRRHAWRIVCCEMGVPPSRV